MIIAKIDKLFFFAKKMFDVFFIANAIEHCQQADQCLSLISIIVVGVASNAYRVFLTFGTSQLVVSIKPWPTLKPVIWINANICG